MSHVIWKYKHDTFHAAGRDLNNIEHVPASWDWLPWVKAKRDREAQEQYVKMSYAVPGRSDSMPEILAPTQEQKVITTLNLDPVALLSQSGRNVSNRTYPSFESTQASQWSTSERMTHKLPTLQKYVKVEREGQKLKIETNPQQIKTDVRAARQLVRNYRAQKQMLQDSRIFI